MADIYQRQRTVYAGTFSSDTAAMTFAGLTTPLGIVQNVQVTFAQNTARIYDVSNGGAAGVIGGNAVPVYYVGGRTQGNAAIGRVIGPQSGALCKFYETIGNVCTPQDLTFTLRGGCDQTTPQPRQSANAVGVGPTTSATYQLQGCVMTNMGFNITSQDMIVNEQISLMFANLTCEDVAGR